MERLTFKQQYNYDYKKYRNMEIDWGVSRTVPSQAYTVKEILDRVKRGRSNPDINIESFKMDNGEVEFEDINPLEKSPDSLTTGDEIKKELSELGLKRKIRDDKKIADEAKKRLDESKAKVREEIMAEEEKKKSDQKPDEKSGKKSTI